MLSEQPPAIGAEENPLERRLSSIRLFVVRDGRLVELERRERLPTVANEPAAPYSVLEIPPR
jgi:hypothetical protein